MGKSHKGFMSYFPEETEKMATFGESSNCQGVWTLETASSLLIFEGNEDAESDPINFQGEEEGNFWTVR